MRNFGIQSGARDPGGVGISRSAYSANTRTDLNVIQFADRHPSRNDRLNSEASNPPLFIREAALERGQLSQALIDVFALVFGALFICATALSLPVAIFILLFVKV